MLTHRNMLAMATDLTQVDPKYAGGRVRLVPAAGLDGRADDGRGLGPGGRLHGQLPRGAGHGPGRPPRDRPAPPLLPAADLGEPGRLGPGQGSSTPRWLKRKVFNLCHADRLPDGRLPLRAEDRRPSGSALLYRLAYCAVFRALKDRLGFSRIRCASTGGAALGPDTFRFFHALGVNLKQIYGQTEIAGISCIHRDGDVDFNTVGEPIPGAEIRHLAETARSCRAARASSWATTRTTRRPPRPSGTAGSTRATPATSTSKGHLVVIDRVKDVMSLADGTTLLPAVHREQAEVLPLHQGSGGRRARAGRTSRR